MGSVILRQSMVWSVMHSLRLATLLAVGSMMLGCQKSGERSDYQSRVAPVVSSSQLTETEIVPTLDTPLAESGNAVWCATFQVAWNNVRENIIGEPLRITNAQNVANRLNGSPVTKESLPADSYFTAAGRLEDGIVETIRRDMARQFPNVRLPNFEGAVGFVTYGYLNTKTEFTTPFMDTKEPIQFSDAAGVKHSVSGFGLYQGTDWDLRAKQAAQVKVLFSQAAIESYGTEPYAFALDLTADNSKHQLIVAVLPRSEDLRAALSDLKSRIENSVPDEYSEDLQDTDTLKIPNIVFNVNHDFADLQGNDKTIENAGEFQGLNILKATQSIRFCLEKSGATVVSETNWYAGALPRRFVFDRPFLIVMKRRSSNEPFFAAWIDNAELLDVIPKDAQSGP